MHILKSDFPDYQIFLTTYDKPWYEYAKGFLEGYGSWKTMEFYAEETVEGYEQPIIFDGSDLLKKAENHFKNRDHKAAAVYARSAFEEILRKYCEKSGKKITYKSRAKDYTTEHFWNAVKSDIQPETKSDVEQYRALVLNPFSHYDTERHQFKSELRSTLDTVQTLKTDLDTLLERRTHA